MATFQTQTRTAELLEHVVEELDVPPSKHQDARQHYEAVGDWLGREGSALHPYQPVIYPQGSFVLGTAIRPVDCGEYDVDAVCLLRRSPTAPTQQWLKSAVGDRLRAHETYAGMIDPREGGRRCWTLRYADGSQFHLDILPALPDDYRWLLSLGVPEHRARHAMRITDRDRLNNQEWPRSNPAGYAAWFRDRMSVALQEAKIAMAAEKRAEVVSIPDDEVRTPLHRVVQLLKRHRDVTFGCDEDRPISVIITTLAALACQNETDLDTAYRSVVPAMRNHIRRAAAAYEHRGAASTRVRAREIVTLFESAAPVPNEMPACDAAEFLFEIRELVGESILAGGGKRGVGPGDQRRRRLVDGDHGASGTLPRDTPAPWKVHAEDHAATTRSHALGCGQSLRDCAAGQDYKGYASCSQHIARSCAMTSTSRRRSLACSSITVQGSAIADILARMTRSRLKRCPTCTDAPSM